MSEYECSCIICGTQNGLRMFAHRNSSGRMVGWIFTCSHCEQKVADGNLSLQLTDAADNKIQCQCAELKGTSAACPVHGPNTIYG
jgi:hypothetical protein